MPRALFLILALGFLLRLLGLNFGLPFVYHADEPIVVHHALAYGGGDLNPHFFKIPPLVSYLLFGVYGVLFGIGKIAGIFRSAQDFEFLFYANPFYFYVVARFVFGVLLGTLTLYVLYRLVRRHFSESAALLSALFLAVCFLHVRDSHYVYVDIPLVLVMTSAFILFFKIIEKPNLRRHVCAGVAIGLATAIKYNGIALVLPYIFSASIAKKKEPKGFLFAAVASAVTFFILNPYSLLDFSFFIQDVVAQARAQGGAGWLHHLTYSLFEGAGIGLVTFAVLGMVLAFRPIEPKRLVLAVFVIGYYVLISLRGQRYDRYVLPLLPPLCIFASDAVVRIAGTFPVPLRKIVLAIAALVITLPNFVKSIWFDTVMTAKDTRTLAKDWIESSFPQGSHVALDSDFYMPKLSFTNRQLEEKKKQVQTDPHFSNAQIRRLDYLLSHPSKKATFNLYFLTSNTAAPRFLFAQPTLPFDFAVLRDFGIDYVVVARSHEKDKPESFFQMLPDVGPMLIEFNPYRNSRFRWNYDPEPLTGSPFLSKDLFSRKRNGPVIQIYQLK